MHCLDGELQYFTNKDLTIFFWFIYPFKNLSFIMKFMFSILIIKNYRNECYTCLSDYYSAVEKFRIVRIFFIELTNAYKHKHGPFIFETFIWKILLYNLSENKTKFNKLLMDEMLIPPTMESHAMTIYFDKVYLSRDASAQFRFRVLYFLSVTYFVCGIKLCSTKSNFLNMILLNYIYSSFKLPHNSNHSITPVIIEWSSNLFNKKLLNNDMYLYLL